MVTTPPVVAPVYLPPETPLDRLRAKDLASAVMIETYLSQGVKLGAIKVYRESTGVGLKEAKDAIDATCAMNPSLYPQLIPGRTGCLGGAVLSVVGLVAAVLSHQLFG